jgi:hypothetical protein
MIFTNRFPPGFPNGRRLEDDVNAIVCTTGDCLLQELSFIEAKEPKWPRATVNDKPFLNDWPYLAEPWPDRTPPAPPARSIWPYIIAVGLLLAVVTWGVVELLRRLTMWLWWKCCGKRRAAAAA